MFGRRNNRRGRRCLAAVTACAFAAVAARANVMNLPAGETSLQFVTVGNPGNAPDSTGYGAVPYTYQMGEFDVTVAQYTQFLNAVAASDPYGLWNPSMSPGSTSASCGITRSGSSGSYTYSFAGSDPNFPVNNASWLSAARFCNWLENGQPTGAEGTGTTETGAYALNGATGAETNQQLAGITRSPGAIYVIPSENEWYKAAYYDPENRSYWLYPTQSDSTPTSVLSATGTNNANYEEPGVGSSDPTTGLTPVGSFVDSPGPYGTYDMGGDVFQWTEGFDGGVRVVRGGSFFSDAAGMSSGARVALGPSQQVGTVGFRIAQVPEPGSIGILAFVGLFLLRRRRSASV